MAWDRERWRWWKTLDARVIGLGVSVTAVGAFLTFVVGIPGAINMFLGCLLATVAATVVLACLGFIDRPPGKDGP